MIPSIRLIKRAIKPIKNRPINAAAHPKTPTRPQTPWAMRQHPNVVKFSPSTTKRGRYGTKPAGISKSFITASRATKPITQQHHFFRHTSGQQ
jgi:hypothetical protein